MVVVYPILLPFLFVFFRDVVFLQRWVGIFAIIFASSDVDYVPYGMGVQFIMISEEDRDSIASFVLNQQAMAAFTKLQYI